MSDMVHVMYSVELHKSEDVRAICKDQHVEKKNELFVGNNIFLREIHAKFIFFLQAEN